VLHRLLAARLKAVVGAGAGEEEQARLAAELQARC
jgi:hypothetical protein